MRHRVPTASPGREKVYVMPRRFAATDPEAAQGTGAARDGRTAMNEETFNMSLRKYLTRVGVTSQQAIERHVREHGDASGRLQVRTVLTIGGHDMQHVVEGEIDLG
jgi:hypothetical protein